MDIREKYCINFHGLSLGNHHFTLEFNDDLFQLFPNPTTQKGSGIVEIEMLKHSSFMELEVEIKGEIEVECDRCLELYPQQVEFEGSLIAKISEEAGEYDGDIIWLSPRDAKLDLAQWIYESIILGLPIQRVHPEIEDCNPEVVKYITGEVDFEDSEDIED